MAGKGELDMNDGRDRRTLAAGVARGWSLSPERLERYSASLDAALALAMKKRDARAITSCVRTMAAIVAQVQADEHLQAKLAAGGNIEGHEVTIRVVRED